MEAIYTQKFGHKPVLGLLCRIGDMPTFSVLGDLWDLQEMRDKMTSCGTERRKVGVNHEVT